MNENNNFYLDKSEPNKSCLLSLRNIIIKQDQYITETKKYGMPCFCYKNKIFCYLWVDKKPEEPFLLFVEGDYLNHPELEAVIRKCMNIFRVNPNQDIP